MDGMAVRGDHAWVDKRIDACKTRAGLAWHTPESVGSSRKEGNGSRELRC